MTVLASPTPSPQPTPAFSFLNAVRLDFMRDTNKDHRLRANITFGYRNPGDATEVTDWVAYVEVLPIFREDHSAIEKAMFRLKALADYDIANGSFWDTGNIPPTPDYVYGAYGSRKEVSASQIEGYYHKHSGYYVYGVYYVIAVLVTTPGNANQQKFEQCGMVYQGSLPWVCDSKLPPR